jgi:hypothetical protein
VLHIGVVTLLQRLQLPQRLAHISGIDGLLCLNQQDNRPTGDVQINLRVDATSGLSSRF